jgi:hypothetical protein
MNGPMPAICRRAASRFVAKRFFTVFSSFMINMYYYVLKKATKKRPAPKYFSSQAETGRPRLGISFLSKALHLPSKVRQFHFLRC